MASRAKRLWFSLLTIAMISGAGFVLGARQAVAEQVNSCAPAKGSPCAFAAECTGMCYRVECGASNCQYWGGTDCWLCDPGGS